MRLTRVAAIATIGALALAGCAAAGAVERPEPASDLTAELARGINDAGYEIFKAAADSSENIAVSPVSIGIAFGMADAGARGSVAEAIEQAFGFPGTGDDRLAAFNAYEQALSLAPGTEGQDPVTGDKVTLPTVIIANRVYTDTDFEPRTEYTDTLKSWFGADAEAVPMRSNPGTAADAMNSWVDERTEGLIQDLFDAGSFRDDSRLTLLNALYLKAAWQEELDPDDTDDEMFTDLDGIESLVPLMDAAPTTSAIAQGEHYVAAALTYAGAEHEMLVIVPDTGSFEHVRARLGTELIEELDSAWISTVGQVRIPRFEAGSVVNLRKVMESTLGWNGIFGVEGLDGIAQQLELSSSAHATKVIVNEEGTEAAAVTELGVSVTSIDVPEFDVIADRPFLYVIRHVDTDATLFVGQVLDPRP